MISLPKNVPAPAMRAFVAAGYDSLEKFTAVSEKELLMLHGVGPKAIRILKEMMAEKGLSFSAEDVT